MTPEQYCSDKAAPPGSDFYYTTLYADPDVRLGLHAIQALWMELEASIIDASDESVTRARLDWWRAEINTSLNGSPRHPIGEALLRTWERFDLSREYLDELVDGVEMDLQYTGYQTFSDLNLYLYRTGGVRWMLMAEIQGMNDRQTTKFAHDLGTAVRLAEILQYAGRDCSLGRIYFPSEDMERLGVKPADLMQPQTAERLSELFEAEADRIRDLLDRAIGYLADEDRYPQLASLITVALTRAMLDEIAAEGHNVLEQRTELTPVRKLWIAWRTMRREKRRARKHR